MVQPSRTPSGAGNGSVGGGMHTDGGGGGKDGPRLTAEEVGRRIGLRPRTVYDIWDRGAMWADGVRRADGKWAQRWTFPVCVETYLAARRGAHMAPPPVAPPAPLAHVGPDADAGALEATARFFTGEDAPPETVATVVEKIRKYRRDMGSVPPAMRLLVMEEVFTRADQVAQWCNRLST